MENVSGPKVSGDVVPTDEWPARFQLGLLDQFFFKALALRKQIHNQSGTLTDTRFLGKSFMAYRLSFGSNRLLVSETTRLVSNYLETSNWDQTKSFGMENNVVNYPSSASVERVIHEMCVRLKA